MCARGREQSARHPASRHIADQTEHLRRRNGPAPASGRALRCITTPPPGEGGGEGENITTPYIEPHNTSAWAQYTIRVNNRDAVQEKLKAAGIPTAVHYPIPLNRQPAVADPAAQLPVGDALAQRVLSLPTHPYLDKDSIARIVQVILNRNSSRP